MSAYPPDFQDWTPAERNRYFAEKARHYRERKASPNGELIRVTTPVGGPSGELASVVELVNGASVNPEPINWLWEGWLARGKFHLIGGQPGTGKTTIALGLAATITLNARWPDGSRCAHGGNVVIWSGEDAPEDTLAPRLIASGADMRRVFFVNGVREGNLSRDFDPAKDIAPLQAAIERAGGAALVIVDPVVSAVAGDSHKNAETRRGLQPLVDLCRKIGAALIGVTHFTKGTAGREPIERITGSLAFGALARIVMVAAKKSPGEDEKPSDRFLARAKSNIGPDGDGFTYDLRQVELPGHLGVIASRVEWKQAVAGSARDLLAQAEAVKQEGSAVKEAEKFLGGLLADGPIAAKEVRSAADANGLSWASIKRAKRLLGVEAHKAGFDDGWAWSLPKELKKTEEAQQNDVSAFGEIEPLRVDSMGEVEI